MAVIKYYEEVLQYHDMILQYQGKGLPYLVMICQYRGKILEYLIVIRQYYGEIRQFYYIESVYKVLFFVIPALHCVQHKLQQESMTQARE